MLPLVYSIEPGEGEIGLRVGQGDKPLSVIQWAALSMEGIDREVRLLFLKKKPLPRSSSVPFPLGRQAEALRLLAATGRLFFQGRKLLVDLFRPVSFHLRLVPLEGGGGRVTAWLSEETPFTDAEALFLGGYIGKGWLRLFDPLVEKQWLKPFLSQGSVEWTPEQWRLYREEAALDPTTVPPLIIEEGALPLQVEPLPLLVLTDRVGAFANLLMDYGKGECFAFDDVHKGKGQRLRSLEESWERDLLETSYQRKQVGSSHYYCPVDRVGKSLLFLLEIGWEVRNGQGQRINRYQGADWHIEGDSRFLKAKGRIAFGASQVDLAAVADSLHRKEAFVQLENGEMGLLEGGALREELGPLWQGELVGQEIRFKKSHVGVLSAFQDKIADRALVTLLRPSPCSSSLKDFCGELRPYQREGVDWMTALHRNGLGGILADEMGLGKTVQVLAFLSTLPLPRALLVVVPTSLLFHWKAEVERFLPSWKCYLHHGPERSCQEWEGADLLLVSYALLRRDLPLFEQRPWDGLILDEAQAMKNASTQLAQALLSLQASFRLSLTGTPVENQLQELWTHFHFAVPGLLGEREAFQAVVDGRHFQMIQRKVNPFLLRRRKEEVAKDLPEKIEQVVWVEMEEEQRALYEQFLTGVRSHLLKKVREGSLKTRRLEILEAILRLRQICCHPLLFSGETTASSGKWEALFADLETVLAEGKKVLLYSQFTSLLRLFAKEMEKRGWGFLMLDGQTKDREEKVNAFQKASGPPLFLISLKAGGVGLNLTAADYVFLYDPWWNEAVENQAIDRAHRIGRRQPVVAKRYVTVQSIEEKMMTLKKSKRALAQGLFEEDISLDDELLEQLF